MAFGGQSLVFTAIDYAGPTDSMGEQQQVDNTFIAPGCRHRPLTFKEMVELGYTVAEERWRSTIPLFEYGPALLAQVLATQHDDVITVDGVEYQVEGGIRPHPDLRGRPFKATIISKLHVT